MNSYEKSLMRHFPRHKTLEGLEEWEGGEEGQEDQGVKQENLVKGLVEITLDRGDTNLSEKQNDLLEDIKYFCQKIAETYKQEFWRLIVEYGKSNPAISDAVLSYLKKKHLDLPAFTILYGTRAIEELKNMGFENVEIHGFLLKFGHSKVLANYYWKQTRKVGHTTAVEWGNLYRKLNPIIWRHIENQFGSSKLNFRRINLPRQHDAKNFYYLFDITVR